MQDADDHLRDRSSREGFWVLVILMLCWLPLAPLNMHQQSKLCVLFRAAGVHQQCSTLFLVDNVRCCWGRGFTAVGVYRCTYILVVCVWHATLIILVYGMFVFCDCCCARSARECCVVHLSVALTTAV